MGALLARRKTSNLTYGHIVDTAVLMQNEAPMMPAPRRSCESLRLDGGQSDCVRGLAAFKTSMADSLESDCTTLSTISMATTASPLDTKHRYHVFFAYSARDVIWVEYVVRRLESEPYHYQCCYAARDFNANVTHVQNVLCSIMLSQRIVVVLTPEFVNGSSWGEYEESILHLTLMSQCRLSIVLVTLEQCEVPESVRSWQLINAHDDSFWQCLLQSLQPDSLSFSESLYTIRSVSSSSSGYLNGQVLVVQCASIDGFCQPHLLFDHEELPDPLTVHDVALSRHDYSELMKLVGREDAGLHLSWIFSATPNIALGVMFLLWCTAFTLVILLVPDNTPSTLPVRLCVFSLPAFSIVISVILRWRKLKHLKEQFYRSMFARSVHANRLLYERHKPLLMTTTRSHNDNFYIYFLYFNRTNCIERIKLFLMQCTEDDSAKLSRLIDVYTLNSRYSDGCSLAVRLTVMLSSAYAVNLILRRIPLTLEQRHTKRRQCLCQFVEEFLTAYLSCVRQHETSISNLQYIFCHYMNSQFRPDAIVLQALGISVIDTA